MEYTPDIITTLQPGDIFVFGSNQFAKHDGGAARIARDKFGAINDIAPTGLVSQTYGIITTSFNDKKITLEFIADQVKVLYGFAELRPNLRFFVTKIGTGIAGFDIAEIASVFSSFEDLRPVNIVLPKEFHPIKKCRQ